MPSHGNQARRLDPRLKRYLSTRMDKNPRCLSHAHYKNITCTRSETSNVRAPYKYGTLTLHARPGFSEWSISDHPCKIALRVREKMS